MIIGDRQTERPDLYSGTLSTRRKINDAAFKSEKEKLYCIYVAIGQNVDGGLVVQVTSEKRLMGALDLYLTSLWGGKPLPIAAPMQFIAPCKFSRGFCDGANIRL